jgi:flavin reductase (DIM6/NTAB) family NADH-FMN oxidoreductase RutF
MQFDFATLPPAEVYKLMVSTIVPRPIAWVVTQSADGGVNAAPYSFFNAVSGDPPLVVIGIGGRDNGRAKDTAANIRETGQFVVNLVGEAMVKPMVMTAVDFDAGVDELQKAGLTTRPSIKITPPRIAESPVAFECELFQTISLPGRRDLVLGRIVTMHIDDDCMLDVERRYVDTPALKLVGRMHGGGWYARTSDRFEVKRMSVAEAEAQRAAE